MNKRALILAAGRGSRMGASTDNSHKCLTKLLNKPLLHWQIEAITKAGVNDITVVRGYRSELLQGNFKTVDNIYWAETNMVASLFCAEDFSGETIISYSDIVYKAEHVEKLLTSNSDITILADKKWNKLWELRFENPLDDAETFKSTNGVLTEIGNRTSNILDIEAQYMGLIKVSPNGWNKMKELYLSYDEARRKKVDMTSLIADLLKKQVQINVLFIEGGWCEVDNYNDVVVYEEQLSKNNSWLHNWQ